MHLQEGVGYTMAEFRERFWISKFFQLTKCVFHKCYGSKGFWAVACPASAVGDLPLDCTSGSRQFQVIGTNFAGLLIYTKKRKQEEKPYILLHSCSLTRAAYMDFTRDQSLEEFLKRLQWFMSCRGRPEKVYLDNFSMFLEVSKWLKRILQEEKIHDFLAKYHIMWQFNLSSLPGRAFSLREPLDWLNKPC